MTAGVLVDLLLGVATRIAPLRDIDRGKDDLGLAGHFVSRSACS